MNPTGWFGNHAVPLKKIRHGRLRMAFFVLKLQAYIREIRSMVNCFYVTFT